MIAVGCFHGFELAGLSVKSRGDRWGLISRQFVSAYQTKLAVRR
jgi:hypothetical protein